MVRRHRSPVPPPTAKSQPDLPAGGDHLFALRACGWRAARQPATSCEWQLKDGRRPAGGGNLRSFREGAVVLDLSDIVTEFTRGPDRVVRGEKSGGEGLAGRGEGGDVRIGGLITPGDPAGGRRGNP